MKLRGDVSEGIVRVVGGGIIILEVIGRKKFESSNFLSERGPETFVTSSNER